MDESKKVKAGANSSNIALFSLSFNLINVCLSGVGVTTDLEKADDPNTGVADKNKPDLGTADPKEADGMEADKANIERAEESGISTTDPVKANGAEIDGAKANRADKPNIRPADPTDPAKVDGADKQGTSIADLVEPNGAEADRAKKLDTGLAAEDLQKHPAENKRQPGHPSSFSIKLLVSSSPLRN